MISRFKLQSLNAEAWAVGLTWCLDFIALAALASTLELSPILFVGLILGLALSRLRSIRLSTRFLVSAMIIVVGSALGIWKMFHIPSVLAAAYAAPTAHMLLWFAREPVYRSWRLAIGFMELVLAATITAEFYLAFFILGFVLCACVAISCAFLDRALRDRDPELCRQPLPRGYIRKTFGMTTLIFLAAGAIFPFLPRMNAQLYEAARVGYTEEVSLNNWTKLSGSEGGSAVLWFYPDRNVDITHELYLGLIRGRVLELFDGNNWSPAPRISTRKTRPNPRQITSHPMSSPQQIEAIRGPMPTNLLPVPYGTDTLALSTSDGTLAAERTAIGEFSDRSIKDKKVKYTLTFQPFDVTGQDLPIALHLNVPNEARTERMVKLAKKLFANAHTEREKADRVLEYFRKEGLQPSTEGEDPSFKQTSDHLKLQPIERFLFIQKSGHCEFFASALAILLRLGGVPTRLVAGFRISRPMEGGMLTVRSSDAHAWVEAWSEERGWFPIDPTPRISFELSWLDKVKDTYDMLSGYWLRYVLSFEDRADFLAGLRASYNGSKGALGFVRMNLAWIIAFGAAAMAGWVLYRRTRKPGSSFCRYRAGLDELKRERAKMERLAARLLADRAAVDDWTQAAQVFEHRFGPSAAATLRQWQADYLRARFGPPVSDLREDARQLSQHRRSLQELLSSLAARKSG